VAFESKAKNLVPDDTNQARDVFVRDRESGETERVSISTDGGQAKGESGDPSIGANGRYVAFESRASNLVPDDTNHTEDIFVHDRKTGETTRVSVSSDGTQGDKKSGVPSISADGRFVASSPRRAIWLPATPMGCETSSFTTGRRARRHG
jgi:Tol biopolymer transport system component